MNLTGGLKVLTLEEMFHIHEVAMSIIQNPGLKVESEEILKRLKAKGIPVNFDTGIVTLPPDEVEETIRQMVGCPKWKLNSNGVDYPMETEYLADKIEPSGIGYMHGLIYDFEKKTVRRPNHQDMLNFVKLCNHFGLPGGVGCVSAEVPQSVVSVHAAAAAVKYSLNPIPIEPDTLRDARWVPRVFEVVGLVKDTPYLTNYVSTKSPLTIGGRAVDFLLQQSDDGILTVVSGMPMTGATTPVTIASSLAMHLAEHFGFNTISRLLCKPLQNQFQRRSIAFAPCLMDLRKGAFFITGPEKNLMMGAWCQILGEFYKMPIPVSISAYIDTQEPGFQAAQEKALQFLTGLCFPGYHNERPSCKVGGLGALNSNLTLSYEQVLLDMELIRQLERFLRGIQVDEETLALDTIRSVGPGGNFLDAEHTLAHYRDEMWFPRYNFRGGWDQWVESGRKSPVELAHEKVKEILSKELVPVLSEDKIREIDRVVQEAERDILGKTTGILP